MAKPLKYTKKVAVSFTPEQLEKLKEIADAIGTSVSGLLRHQGILVIERHEDNQKIEKARKKS